VLTTVVVKVHLILYQIIFFLNKVKLYTYKNKLKNKKKTHTHAQ